jgi:hypothetical protein
MFRWLGTGMILVAVVTGVQAFGTPGNLRVCLARIDDNGYLQIRDVGATSSPQTHTVKRQKTTDQGPLLYEASVEVMFATEHILRIRPKDVEVFDSGNNAVDPGRLAELFQREIPIVLCDGGKKLGPAYLPILKKDTLIVVLPISWTPGGYAGGLAVPKREDGKRRPPT